MSTANYTFSMYLCSPPLPALCLCALVPAFQPFAPSPLPACCYPLFPLPTSYHLPDVAALAPALAQGIEHMVAPLSRLFETKCFYDIKIRCDLYLSTDFIEQFQKYMKRKQNWTTQNTKNQWITDNNLGFSCQFINLSWYLSSDNSKLLSKANSFHFPLSPIGMQWVNNHSRSWSLFYQVSPLSYLVMSVTQGSTVN